MAVFKKDPNATLDYTFDWTAYLLPAADGIVSVVWIISAGITRVDSSSQLGIEGVAAVRPGSGTAPDAAGTARAVWPGRGMAPDEGAAAAADAGLTGKICWQVGHLMRAPPAGIFLSSMLRFALQEGHATFMDLLEAIGAKPEDVTLRE